MQNNILCIIDMQPYFSASQELRTIQACQYEIKQAINNNHIIFFVEFEGLEATDSRLTSLTNSYHTVYKDQDDGSPAIMKKVHQLGIVNAKFRICGVNTDACVRHTVYGLSTYGRRGYDVKVIKQACNDDLGYSFQAFQYMKHLTNVTLL